MAKKGETMDVSRSVIDTNFDRAVKRSMLTYQMPVGVALQPGLSLAEYVRNIVHDEIVQRDAAFRERAAAGLRSLSNRARQQSLLDPFRLA